MDVTPSDGLQVFPVHIQLQASNFMVAACRRPFASHAWRNSNAKKLELNPTKKNYLT